MYNIESTIRAFVTRVLNASRTKGRCHVFSAHIVNSKSQIAPGSVAEVEIPDPLPDNGIDVTVSELCSAIRADANGAGGVTTYILRAQFTEGGVEQTARVRCAADDTTEILSDDVPESKGKAFHGLDRTVVSLIDSAQNHTAQFARITAGIFQTGMMTMQRTVESQSQRLEAMEARHIQHLELMEKLMTEEHVRKLAEREHENKLALRTKLGETAIRELPSVARKFLGLPAPAAPAPQLPAGEKARSKLAVFLGSLPRETLMQVFNALTPDQRTDCIFIMGGGAPAELDEKVIESISEEQGLALWGLLNETQREQLLSLSKEK